MKMTAILCGTTFLALLFCGCFTGGGSILPAKEYDLPLNEGSQRTAVATRIGLVRNLSGAGHSFLLRGANGRIAADETRRWILSPETMVERELRRSFLAAESNDLRAPVVDAAIYRFDITESKSEFNFAVLYTIRLGGRQTPFLFRKNQKIEQNNVPAAVEKCLAESTQALEKELMKNEKK